MLELTFRMMRSSDLATVSELGIASKQSWGYCEEQMKIFAEELRISANDFSKLTVAEVACREDEIVGHYTIREHSDGVTELEHLFVAPDRFGEGIGSQLLRRTIDWASSKGIPKLKIISDPHSSGFYEKFGAIKTGDHQSSIPGRTIPIYEIVTS